MKHQLLDLVLFRASVVYDEDLATFSSDEWHVVPVIMLWALQSTRRPPMRPTARDREPGNAHPLRV